MVTWKGPTLVIGLFVVGTLLAVGHHLFYKSLDGTLVPTASDDGNTIYKLAHLTPQRFNTSVGTAFAFLTKTFLGAAVAAVYTQMFFIFLKRQTTKLSTIDAAFSVASNPLSLFVPSVWRRYTAAAVVAGFLWLLPITTVVTPATLTVGSNITSATNMIDVPNVDFTSLNFANLPHNLGAPDTSFTYRGPQYFVTGIVNSVASSGVILPFSAPAPNASYTQTFPGPMVKCEEVSGDVLAKITTEMMRMNNDTASSPISYGYVSWVPDGTWSVPFQYTPDGPWLAEGDPNWRLAGGTISMNAPASVFIAVLPSMVNLGRNITPQSSTLFMANATVLQCKLFNATYELNFRWLNGARSLDITPGTSYDPIQPLGFLDPVTHPGTPGLLPSSVASGQSNPGPYAYNVTLVQTMAYQAVMEAFDSLLVGTIGNTFGSEGALQTTGTSVMSTVLGNTAELAFLREYGIEPINGNAATFQSLVAQDHVTWPGLSVPANATVSGNKSLGSAVEELFQNITVSLMSSPLLQADPRSPYAPPPVPVTIFSTQNVYVYSAKTLWLAYGISIALSAVAVIIGLATVISQDAYYSGNFSTIVRLARGADISTPIVEKDAAGEDPLPKHLANATMSFTAVPAKEGRNQTEMYSLQEKSGAGVRTRLL